MKNLLYIFIITLLVISCNPALMQYNKAKHSWMKTDDITSTSDKITNILLSDNSLGDNTIIYLAPMTKEYINICLSQYADQMMWTKKQLNEKLNDMYKLCDNLRFAAYLISGVPAQVKPELYNFILFDSDGNRYDNIKIEKQNEWWYNIGTQTIYNPYNGTALGNYDTEFDIVFPLKLENLKYPFSLWVTGSFGKKEFKWDSKGLKLINAKAVNK